MIRICEPILSLSPNASHEDEFVFFSPQGIKSSASRPEILWKSFFHKFYQNRG